MSSSLTVNFYDTIATLPLSIKTLTKLQEFISDKFQMLPEDVQQLEFHYYDQDKVLNKIKNNLDFARAVNFFSTNNSVDKEIMIKISESSKLFNEFFNQDVPFESIISKIYREDSPSQIEKLKLEITQKEKELQSILEKERIEREKKEVKEAEQRLHQMQEEAFNKHQEKIKLALQELDSQKELIAQKAKEESQRIKKRINEKREKKAIDEKIKKEAKAVKNENKEANIKVKPTIKKIASQDKIIKKGKTSVESFNKIDEFIQKVIDKNVKSAMIEYQNKIKENELKAKHKKQKEIEKKKEVIHQNVTCDGCGKKDFQGIRYKCSVCYNFDYCEECEEKFTEEHQHPFLKIRIPSLVPIEFKCELENNEKEDIKEEDSNKKDFFKKMVSKVNKFIGNITKSNDNGSIYEKQASELKLTYELNWVENDKIIKALEKFNGDEAKTLESLFE